MLFYLGKIVPSSHVTKMVVLCRDALGRPGLYGCITEEGRMKGNTEQGNWGGVLISLVISFYFILLCFCNFWSLFHYILL